jgi:NTE family protein
MEQTSHDLRQPVRFSRGEELSEPSTGVALCLSGGGYRAMLFHVGVLRRLNEMGWLPRIDRFSSVSGGSITAAVLALAWDTLDFDSNGYSRRYVELVEEPINGLADQTIDVSAVLGGVLSPFATVGERVAAAYRAHLFGDAKLGDLPKAPRFVFNATNVGSGSVLRFNSAPYVADWRVGRVLEADVDIAVAVACSSAFPPVLSPFRLSLSGKWTTDAGNDLATPEHRDELVLTDGGVYDNLGLETAWKQFRTVLVSDAGGQLAPDPDPQGDWARHMIRVLKVVDNQVRSLRKRQVIAALKDELREGSYFGIRSDISHFELPDTLHAPYSLTSRLADIPTRLAKTDRPTQRKLVNWGYAIADAAVRRWVDTSQQPPVDFPHPEEGVG